MNFTGLEKLRMWGGASAQWAENHREQLEGLACGSQQEDQDNILGLLEERTMTIFTRKMRKGIQGVVPDTCNPNILKMEVRASEVQG